jgi:flagellar basal-body rod protein FlgC
MSNNLMEAMANSMTGMKAQSRRLEVVSENLSNADTPGYKRKLLSFTTALTNVGAASNDIGAKLSYDLAPGERLYDPAHPMADPEGFVTMSNVSFVTELADMREANRSYEANLNSFKQAHSMYKSLIDLLRR